MFGFLKKKKTTHIVPNETGTPFERHLYYAENGGLMYQFFVGYDYAVGVKKGDIKHPAGIPQNVPKAIPYLKKAAEKDVEKAQELLGLIYFGNLGESYVDYEKSFYWFSKAAENGSASAQNMIAMFYETGVVVEKDLDTAYHWYLEAASNGEEGAMGSLCKIYREKALSFSPVELNGSNRKAYFENAELSFKWGKKASELGNFDAAYLIGLAYYSGFGTRENKDEAKKYLMLSAKNGIDDAKKFLSNHF